MCDRRDDDDDRDLEDDTNYYKKKRLNKYDLHKMKYHCVKQRIMLSSSYI